MIYILLPAYNEEEGIEKLLERLIRITQTFIQDYKIIIVDDGSTDHTLQVIECFKDKLNIEIISFPENKGIVEVFRAGFKKVCDEGTDDDICITMDSDNTQTPYIILDIVEKMRSSYDIVIASRFAEGGELIGVTWFRYILSFSVAFLMGRIARIPGVTDYSSFYRGIQLKVLKRAFEKHGDDLIAGKGFSGMGGLLVKLRPFSQKIGEVPLVLRYDLKLGKSGISIYKSIVGYLELFKKLLTQKGNP
ncbi:MAG: glycosyltransferase [Nitrospinales bacterium]